MRIKPKPYQYEGVHRLEDFDGRALLADDMGLGKTLQALWFLRRNKTWPAVVICPAALKWNWYEEVKMILPEIRVQVLDRGVTHFDDKAQLTIVNYDILHKWKKELCRRVKRKGKRARRVRTVILDEAHYIKNRSTQRTVYSKQICRGVPFVLALTGTAITNRPIELWTILNLLYPKWWPSYNVFGMRYCEAKMTPWGWKFDGAENVKELHRLLKRRCMVRRLKKDVLKDLPPLEREIIQLPLSKVGEYKKAEREFVSWLKKRHPKKAKRALKAEKLVRFGYLLRLAAELKLPNVVEWLKAKLEDTDQKIIVCAIHKKVIASLKETFPDAMVIDGSVASRKRQEITKQFKKSKRRRILLNQMTAGGVGLNITAAELVVFVELGHVPAEHTQMEARAHRFGQKKKVTAYYLLARNTIEISLCKRLQIKQSHCTSILDGENVNSDSLNIYDLLEEDLLNGSTLN